MSRQVETIDDLPDLVPLAQAAFYLHVSPRTLRRMAARGEIRLIKVSRKNLVQRLDLRALVESRKSEQ